MSKCLFPTDVDATQPRKWTCLVCNKPTRFKYQSPPRRNCPEAPDVKEAQSEASEKLGVSVEEVVGYGMHVVHWVALGCPMRSDEQVAACLAVCHNNCKHYREGQPPADPDNPPSWMARVTNAVVFWRKNGYCKICGCGVSASKFPLVNMVRMKVPDLGCKESKWPTDSNHQSLTTEN